MSTVRNVTDLNLVAFLKVRGHKETESPKLIDGHIIVFSFENTPKLIEDIGNYFNREGMVEAMSMAESLRYVKGLVWDVKRNSKGGDDDGK